MNEKTKKTVISMIVGTLKAEIVAFGLYILAVIPINLFVYHEDYQSERDFTPVYFIMVFIYAIAFYLMYAKKNVENDEVGEGTSGEKFDLWADVIGYIRGDGKYLFIIYGVLAVVFEVCYIFAGGQSFAALFAFNFPLAAAIPVPILRTAVSYILLMVLLLAAVEYARYKKYKYWHSGSSK